MMATVFSNEQHYALWLDILSQPRITASKEPIDF